MIKLNAVQFTTTGDQIFFVTDWELTILKDDPEVIVLEQYNR